MVTGRMVSVPWSRRARAVHPGWMPFHPGWWASRIRWPHRGGHYVKFAGAGWSCHGQRRAPPIHPGGPRIRLALESAWPSKAVALR